MTRNAALRDRTVALFVAEDYEDLEFWYPYYRMQEEGADVVVIGPSRDTFTGKHGVPVDVNLTVDDVSPDHVDGLILPGGYSPDRMRRSPDMVEFVKDIHRQRKPVAAICHAGWMLASAGVAEGTRLTSFYSIKDDLVNAGAKWVDEEVVEDGNVITSRTPADLPAFCRAIIRSVGDQ